MNISLTIFIFWTFDIGGGGGGGVPGVTFSCYPVVKI